MDERAAIAERKGGLRVPPWLPNAISVGRLLLVPLLALLLLHRRLGAAAAVIVIAALSDALDGWLARRYRLETRFGAFLDPLADKLTQATVLVLLAALGKVPFWLFALVLARELLLVYGAVRIRLARRKVTIRARLEGKLSTLLLFAVSLLACLGASERAVTWLSVATAPVIVLAAVRYTLDGRRQLLSASARSAP
jgi:cardiolipin synthase